MIFFGGGGGALAATGAGAGGGGLLGAGLGATAAVWTGPLIPFLPAESLGGIGSLEGFLAFAFVSDVTGASCDAGEAAACTNKLLTTVFTPSTVAASCAADARSSSLVTFPFSVTMP